MESFTVMTSSREEMVDITRRVAALVASSGVRNGLCTVYSPHTTAGVTVNEHADPDVALDIIADLSRLVPAGGRFAHREGNSDAHVKTTLVGSSVTLIVENGRPLLGTWQGIFLAEFDGPRERSVWVGTIGD